MKTRLLSVAVALVAMASGAALAQTAIGKADTVEGTVVVVRGADTYPLAAGDQVFANDRVLTRTDGTTTISANGCAKTLAALQSIVVDAEFCTKVPIALGEGATNVAAAGGGIGATPAILGVLGVGGAAAAAASGGDSVSP